MVKTKTLKIITFYWIPLFVWMGIIFYLSSRPVLGTGLLYWPDFVIKKTAHFIVYFILAYFWFRALIKSGMDRKNAYMVTILACVLYAVSDEYHQSFVFGRGPTVRDVLIDSIGATSYVFLNYKKQKRNSDK